MDDTADDAPEWYRILQLRQHVVRIATLASRASFARWRNDMFRKTQTVVDEDLFLLVVHLMAYPTASNDEIRRFIFKEGRNRSLYSRVVAENLVREELFWTTPFPTGVKSIPIDEDVRENKVFHRYLWLFPIRRCAFSFPPPDFGFQNDMLATRDACQLVAHASSHHSFVTSNEAKK